MSSFGVLTTGFKKKLVQDVLSEIEADLKSNINPNLNLLPTSVLGQLNSVYADKIRELWDVSEAIYNAFDPDAAGGASQDNLAALTGTVRLPQTKSTVTLSVTIDNGTTLSVGRVVKDSTTGVQFQTVAEVTNSSGVAASFNVAAESVNFGPVAASAGSLSTILTPVTGWTAVTNSLDAVPGTNTETDAELRIRREEVLRVSGAATREAIRSAVRAIAGVTQANIFENTTFVTDANGLPPKSFEIIASGSTQALIAKAIFDTKPVGIASHGQISEVITDSEGVNHTIKFSRPTELLLWADVNLTFDPLKYPATGDADVKTAIDTFVTALLVGDDLIYKQVQCKPFDVSGVVDISLFEISVQGNTADTAGAAPWNIQVGQTLTILAGNETVQTITFTSGFTVGAATAAEVAAVISGQISNATVAADSPSAGKVRITGLNGGSVLVTGGTANAVLAFPTTLNPTGVANISTLARQLITSDTARITVNSTSI